MLFFAKLEVPCPGLHRPVLLMERFGWLIPGVNGGPDQRRHEPKGSATYCCASYRNAKRP